MFGYIGIEKYRFHCFKSRIFLEDVDIQNVLVTNNISCGEKL